MLPLKPRQEPIKKPPEGQVSLGGSLGVLKPCVSGLYGGLYGGRVGPSVLSGSTARFDGDSRHGM